MNKEELNVISKELVITYTNTITSYDFIDLAKNIKNIPLFTDEQLRLIWETIDTCWEEFSTINL